MLRSLSFSFYRRTCFNVTRQHLTCQPTGRALSNASTGGGKVPISLLSGFLGSGKTTLLKELLENKGGLRVGVVVNDVASVNIDAKLIRDRSSSGIQTKSGEGVEFVELENGCACCNASEELLGCILQLIDTAQVKGYKFDRIVIEMSGVAEPKNVRREFQEAAEEKHPIFDATELSTMITVVDSPHFSRLYSSKNDVADHEELIGTSDQAVERYDAMKSVEVERKVVDLLVEQIECADAIILNKIDRIEAPKLESVKGIVSALNPAATVMTSKFGKIDWSSDTSQATKHGRTPLEFIFGRETPGVITGDDDEDMRKLVQLTKEKQHASAQAHTHGERAGHTHESSSPADSGHGHSHAHEAAPAAAGHAHSHGGEAHGAAAAAAASGGHGHSHGGDAHDHGDHDHGHSHGHRPHVTTAAEKYGITTFVYSRRRPFHVGRLQQLIGMLPVKTAVRSTWIDHMPAENWALDKLAEGTLNPSDPLGKVRSEQAVMHAVIRSKGFVWAAGHGRTVLYWSHAGAHFEMSPLGLWWAATPLTYWPDGGNVRNSEVVKVAAEFDTKGLYGDRRQEIVFIGIHMDQGAIEKLLDGCLLTDKEMAEYAAHHAAVEPDPVRVALDPAAPGGRRPVQVGDGGGVARPEVVAKAA